MGNLIVSKYFPQKHKYKIDYYDIFYRLKKFLENKYICIAVGCVWHASVVISGAGDVGDFWGCV